MKNNDVNLLTICIISHKQAYLVIRLLESIKRHQPGFRFEVIVLENVKSEEPLNVDKYSFKVAYMQNAIAMGLSKNINKVFESISDETDYFCILNPDIVFRENIFDLLIDAMQQYKVDIIAPLMLDDKGCIQDSFRSIPTPVDIILRYLGIAKVQYQKEDLPEMSFPDWFGAMFMLMQCKVFDEIGGFEPKYNLYFEDVDFCIRAKLKGYELGIFRDAYVIHDAQRTSHKKLSYLFRHAKSAVRFFFSDVNRQYRNK